MKLVRSRLSDHAHNAAHEVAELGGRVLGNQVEFLNRIHAGRKADVIFRDLIVIKSVQQIIIGLFAVAVDVGTAAAEGRLRAGEFARVRGYRPGASNVSWL